MENKDYLDEQYSRYFENLKKDWEFDMDRARDTFRAIPIVGEDTQKNLLYLESLTLNLDTPAGFFMRRKDYDSYQICYTTKGHGKLFYAGNEYDFFPGDCFFIDCKKEHYYFTEGERSWVHHGLQVRGHQMEYLFEKFYEKNTVKVTLSNLEQVSALFMEIAETCKNQYINSDWLLNLKLWELITMLIAGNRSIPRKKFPPKISKVCSYIEENYLTIESIDEIARACYISKYYMCREFKDKVGRTVGDYLTAVRINKAKILLISTDKSLEEIAYEVGYSASYFFNIFKRSEGITPHQYRKNNRGL